MVCQSRIAITSPISAGNQIGMFVKSFCSFFSLEKSDIFLALAKRRDDLLILKKTSQKLRNSLDGYSLKFVNVSLIIMATVTIFSYILYCMSPKVIERTGSDNIYLTSFFVILSILRYLQISFVEENSGSPTKIVLHDPFIQLMILGWICTFYLLLY